MDDIMDEPEKESIAGLRKRVSSMEVELATLKKKLRALVHCDTKEKQTAEAAKKRVREKQQRERLNALPALEKEVQILRDRLVHSMMLEEALPGPHMPRREELPDGVIGHAKTAFQRRSLSKHKTAMSKWIVHEKARLQKAVDALVDFDASHF